LLQRQGLTVCDALQVIDKLVTGIRGCAVASGAVAMLEILTTVGKVGLIEQQTMIALWPTSTRRLHIGHAYDLQQLIVSLHREPLSTTASGM
jgi:hypothetical protein